MGLSPQYYDGCTDDVLNLYAELEDRIISDVVRRIVKTGDITDTAKWQIRQAQQRGLLYALIKLQKAKKNTPKGSMMTESVKIYCKTLENFFVSIFDSETTKQIFKGVKVN